MILYALSRPRSVLCVTLFRLVHNARQADFTNDRRELLDLSCLIRSSQNKNR